MHVIRNTEEIRKFIGEKKTAVALGAFDGLHIGHYKVIRTAVESGLTPVVFTFRDNPAEYLTGTCCYLTTVEERMRILESWGVEHVVMPDFAQVAEWPAERFANLLRFGLNAKRIACGADFRFGKFAAGDTEWLKKLCEAHGGEMHVVPTVEYKASGSAPRASVKRLKTARWKTSPPCWADRSASALRSCTATISVIPSARRPLTRISRRASCCRASACTPPPCMWTAKPTAA